MEGQVLTAAGTTEESRQFKVDFVNGPKQRLAVAFSPASGRQWKEEGGKRGAPKQDVEQERRERKKKRSLWSAASSGQEQCRECIRLQTNNTWSDVHVGAVCMCKARRLRLAWGCFVKTNENKLKSSWSSPASLSLCTLWLVYTYLYIHNYQAVLLSNRGHHRSNQLEIFLLLQFHKCVGQQAHYR